MKLTVNNGNTTIEVDGNSTKELFEKIAELQEIFTGEACGLCNGNTRYGVRVVDDNKYYEMVCTKCGAHLEFGQLKKGDKLFPKRYLKQGKMSVKDPKTGQKMQKGKFGWEKYDPTKKKEQDEENS